MLFNFFHYCEGFVKEPITPLQANPASTSTTIVEETATNVVPEPKPIQPKTDENGNFIPLEQEDADVNFDLASQLNDLQDDKDFGNPPAQDEWKSDKIGEWFEKGGGLEALSNFDIDDLDPFEKFMYNDLSKRNPTMPKAEILKVLINNVEGDFSQLSAKLAKIAKASKGKFAQGGGLKQKGKSDKKHDKDYKAKRVGYRYTDEFAKKHKLSANAKPTQEHIDKYLGKGVYLEDRANRSDKSRMKKI